jgi:hypothetical protein
MATRSRAKPATRPATSNGVAAGRAAPARGGATAVAAWEEDPGEPSERRQPIARPVPNLAATPLPLEIAAPAVAPKSYKPGTSQFRYWTAAEALRRAADFWGKLLPQGVTWQPGGKLKVLLDEGVDLNAYYDRQALNFFHATVGGTTFFSGESPDVVCHEEGHAVLDAIRPQLWDAASIEAAAFHESFGDMSAILSALQLPSVRQSVLQETNGRLRSSSRLSRLAEQLGYAIRQVQPDAVDADCLRNAVNSFFYTDPAGLPPRAPASSLASEPHSFSRVFTGAFFEALAGMAALLADPPTDANLLQASQDMGRLLVDAAIAAPIVPDYFSQIAAHLIEADGARFSGKYSEVIKGAYVRHGILSLDAMTRITAVAPTTALDRAALDAAPPAAAPLPMIALTASSFGLGNRPLMVSSPGEARRLPAAASALDAGSITPPSNEQAARSFVEDLFRRNQVATGTFVDANARARVPHVRPTHRLVEQPGTNALTLVRIHFD